MAYYPPPNAAQKMGNKIRGIIILCVMIIVTGMMVYIAYVVNGSIFSGFDPLFAHLNNAPAQSAYNFLVSISSSTLIILGVASVIAVLGIIALSIFGITGGREEY